LPKNMNQYWRHREAWKRIESANEAEYYFEVVTLCESVISDRLLSYIGGVNPQIQTGRYETFAELIRTWKRLVSAREDDKVPQIANKDLCTCVDEWRKKRNEIIHGLAKSRRGTNSETLDEFLGRAKSTANEGTNLAKAVNKWHKQRLKAHQRNVAEMPA